MADDFSKYSRPSITIPPPEALAASTSPSPMTIASDFFDSFLDAGAEYRGSFSQLLAGAIASPSTGTIDVCSGPGAGFKQSRPANLTVPIQAPISTFFPVSPGFSPSAFFNSPAPAFFSPTGQSPFGISHQQALAQVTAQAGLSQFAYPSSSSAADPMDQPARTHQSFIFSTPSQENNIPRSMPEPKRQRASELPRNTHADSMVSVPFPAPVGKPADDGYNWRKYGQKQVKSSEYPRSYYKCTSRDCPVKKKVERSRDGHIIEIIYKGQHNHGLPQTGKKAKENSNASTGFQLSRHGGLLGHFAAGLDEDSAQATSIQLHGPSDSEESGDGYQGFDENDDEEEPNAKRRNTGAGTSEAGMPHRTMTEPKIVVQTRSPVDLLEDGYRWRKYGQKVVKGNHNPRSYYKCTTVGCNVRKQVERSSTDPEAVVTTYEGKHTHDVPAGRNSGGNAQATQHNWTAGKNVSSYAGNNGQQPIAFLRLKEEQGL